IAAGGEKNFGKSTPIGYIGILENMRIDPDGIKIAGLILALAIALWTGGTLFGRLSVQWTAVVVLLFGLFALSFFRDPERDVPSEKGTVISAADGVVIDASRVPVEEFGPEGAMRIAVFMSVFNVHVNRCPVEGRVIAVRHYPGKKLSAYNKRAEYENEHGDTDLDTPEGPVRIRQIAGLIARRVVTRVQEGDELHAGDRIGLIRFGSRVDVFLPVTYEPAVRPGDHVRAGETVIARIRTESR
ncbi:MAG TPA: phosphatidylserine decarboxylase, partial [Armatimonadota bacterium]|nr:phosphatidylserine decarboxylase [Armatimonadota bacterium]